MRRRNTAIVEKPPAVSDSDESADDDLSSESKPIAKRIQNRLRDTVCEVINTTDAQSSNPPIKIILRLSTDSQTSANRGDEDSSSSDAQPSAEKQKRPSTSANSTNNKKVKTTTSNDAIKDCKVVLHQLPVRLTRAKARSLDSNHGDESDDIASMSENTTSTDQQLILTKKKNIDKTMTARDAKECVHCPAKSQKALSTHYITMHPNEEVYNARMSTEMVDKLRKQKIKPIKWVSGKATVFCYFCEDVFTSDRANMIRHMVRHTGEYKRQCAKCDFEVTPEKSKCDCAPQDIRPVTQLESIENIYVCNLCNYAQFEENHLEQHIRNMHDIETNVRSQYSSLEILSNFGKLQRRNRARKLLAADMSEPSESGSDINSINDDTAFKPSNKDDDLDLESLRSMKENAFNCSTPVSTNKTTSSIVDRLSQRFQQQVKEEEEKFDEANVTLGDVPETEATNLNVTTTQNQVEHNIVLVNEAKQVEIEKCEEEVKPVLVDHHSESDDTDDVNWETTDGSSSDEEKSPIKRNNLFIGNLNRKQNKKRLSRKRKATEKSPVSSKKDKKEFNASTIVVIEDASANMATSSKPRDGSIQKKVTRIDNICFTDHQGQLTFQCNIGNCLFTTVKSCTDFGQHLNTHNEAWTGLCHACDKQILNGTFALSKEIKHMQDVHLPKEAKPVKKLPEPTKQNLPRKILSTPIEKPKEKITEIVPEMLQPAPPQSPEQAPIPTIPATSTIQISAVASMQSPAIQSPTIPPIVFYNSLPPVVTKTTPFEPLPVEKPRFRLKCRRIPGDKLSTVTTAPTADITNSQHTNLIISNVTSLPVEINVQNTEESSTPSQEIAFENKLKPWTTNCVVNKSEKSLQCLVRDASLVALFKCMAADCIFTTNDANAMHQHIENHEIYVPPQNMSNAQPISCDSSWLDCAYCEHLADNTKNLIDHITKAHLSSIYQCAYCFYRSVEASNVESHMKTYHPNERELTFVCGTKPKSLSEDIEQINSKKLSKEMEFLCPEAGKIKKKIKI